MSNHKNSNTDVLASQLDYFPINNKGIQTWRIMALFYDILKMILRFFNQKNYVEFYSRT